MPSIIEGPPRLHFVRDFQSLQPNDARLDNIGLLCVDLENVFVPLGGNTVKQADKDHVLRFVLADITVVGLTNMTDHDRAQDIADQLGMEGVIAKGMRTAPSEDGIVLRSKSHSDMFEHAVDVYGFGAHGKRAAMLDNQLKNIQGVHGVPRFTDYFWMFPNYFNKQHKGVLAGRTIEVPIGFGIIGLQKLGRLLDDNAE